MLTDIVIISGDKRNPSRGRSLQTNNWLAVRSTMWLSSRWRLWLRPEWWSTAPPWSATNHRGTRSTFSAWWSRTLLLPLRTSTFSSRKLNDLVKIYKTGINKSLFFPFCFLFRCSLTETNRLLWELSVILFSSSIYFLQSHIFKSIFAKIILTVIHRRSISIPYIV